MKRQLTPELTMEFEDIGEGAPLVLLHGFPLSLQMWRKQADDLKVKCRVITPNLRGFGGTSGFASTPSVQQMAEDIKSLLEALRIHEPVVLGGLSMGGYVALAFARSHSDRLRGLILADTRAEADTAEGKANREKTIAFAEAHSGGEVIDQMLPRLVNDGTRDRRPEVVTEIRDIASAQTRQGIVGALKALRDRPDSTPFLASIMVPTLVIVGQDDVLTPPAASQTLVKAIRGAQLVMLPDAGHLSSMEQPKLFNGAVDQFLRLVGKTSRL